MNDTPRRLVRWGSRRPLRDRTSSPGPGLLVLAPRREGGVMEDPAMDATGSTDRRRVEERVRILAAIDRALEDRVTVLQLIGESEGRTQAREALMARFGWTRSRAPPSSIFSG